MNYVIVAEQPDPAELLSLYGSVGWASYTCDPETLIAAIAASSCVLTARDDAGTLVGLARTVSDGYTIAYVQDLLVSPPHQRHGVGGALLDEVLTLTAQIRQVVLTTDSGAAQRAFYESRGLVEVHDVEPNPLRSFVRLR